MNRLVQSATPKEPRLKAWVLTGSIVSGLLCAQSIAAQVVPDSTLPVGERSQVSGNPNAQVDGGARRGGNLFHSFSQFPIPTGGSAYFNNAADVQNIFSRVTGRSISNIDGLIRANGTANLFLLNPNGILFGPDASLNIGGSFVVTTANAIGFPNGEVFSSDATQPLPSQLLTVNPSAFFFNQLRPQPIIVQSRFDERIDTQASFSGTGLHVPPGKNLLLMGGPIQFDSGEPFSPVNSPGQPLLVFFNPYREVQPNGGWLISPGSYVELVAVGGVGTVGLSTANSDWQLMIPNAVPRADVSFSNGSGIDVRGVSGSIRVLAQTIDISKSVLYMGIPSDSRLSNTQTGDLELNATGSIAFSMSLLDYSLSGLGTTGSIHLIAGDPSELGGANRVSLDLAAIYNSVQPTGVGNTGDINITTGSLSLTNRSGVQSYTDGQGSTGNININARDTVSFDDFGNVFNTVRRNGVGNAGNINITTRSLFLSNKTEVASFTTGQGNTSNINIDARDTISLTQNSGLLSYTSGQGNAGSINLNAFNIVSLDQHSNVYNFVLGDGSSGGTNITTGSLSLTNGSSIYSNTFGRGNAGSVKINARDRVSLDGEYTTTINIGGRIVPLSYNTSTIYTTVGSNAVGRGGDVTIATNSLSLTNGGAVNTSTAGRGNAGRVTINARGSVEISSTAPTRPDHRSEVVTSTQPGAVGNAGDIDITARSLSLRNGAQFSATTAGEGNAGNIQIRTEMFEVSNGAAATVSSSSQEQAGSLLVTADRIFLDKGKIQADTSGGGGNIELRSPLILLRNGSNITTNATGANIPGGNIAIDTRFLVAVLNEDSNISANSEDFRGGNVRINAVSIFGIRPSPVSTSLSDITATGATSALSGTIDVITAGIDPTSGLIELPTDLTDPSGLIAQGCPANQGNSFVIVGRGGLPPTPEQQLDDDAEWSDRRRLVAAGEGRGQEAEGRRKSRGGHGDAETGGHGDAQNSKFKIQNSKFSHTPHPTPKFKRSTQLAQSSPPPPRRNPRGSSAGGRRDSSNCPQDAEPAPTETVLTALSPTTKPGLTVAEHPTFLIYVPKTSAKTAEFSLRSRDGRGVYRTTLALTNTPNLITLTLPAQTPPLAVGQPYTWSFAIICNSNDRLDDRFVTGMVQRIELDPTRLRQIQQAPPKEQVALYQQANVWYDTLAVLYQLKRSQMSDPGINTSWRELLKSGGVDAINDE